MPTRILTTIKESGKLIGFKIISTAKGVGVVNLQKAEEIYKQEPFENVKLEGHSWKGIECSLDKLPSQDKQGTYLKRDAEIIVLRRVLENENTVGFEFMNLDGVISKHNIPDAIKLAKQYGLVNAKLVPNKDGTEYISGIRSELKVKKVKPEVKQPGPTMAHTVIQNNLATPQKPIPPVQPVQVVQTTNIPLNPLKGKVDMGIGTSITVKGSNKVMDDKLKRMKELVDELAKASYAYYVLDDEIMTNFEYDKKEKELLALEAETGVVLANSVTQKVGSYDIKSKLPKVTHPSKMLSLDKTKDRAELAETLGPKEGFLGWKLDGLTVVATYENGKVLSAVTRGNGTIGEDITSNFCNFTNIPLMIAKKDRLVVRGEALISYAVFEEINAKITVEDEKYKNPRNLASGSVRQLDPKITKERKVAFKVFEVVEGMDDLNSKTARLDKAADLGFEVVDYVKVTKDTVSAAIDHFEALVANYEYPTDGLVLAIDDIAYSKSLGTTSKFPRDAKAFKWKDESKETPMVDIDWSCSRTGAINPVAVFEPVDLEGTSVTRASLSNVSLFKGLELGKGDIVTVYKANMIIPQVDDNLTRSNTFKVPDKCPVCGGATKIVVSAPKIRGELPTEVLYCTNADCSAKKVGALAHYVSRDALNMDGIAESTLEKLMSEGIVKTFKDLYYLPTKKSEILALDGVGEGMYNKWVAAVENSREVDLFGFLYGLGVEQLGRTTSKLICKAFDYDLERIITATDDDLHEIDGVGDVTIEEYRKFFGNPANADMVRDLAKELTFKAAQQVNTASPIAGKNIVVTGTLTKFTRDSIKTKIESLGGKSASSVSKKTDFVLYGDAAGSKLDKAKELGVKTITEDEFLAMIGE